MYANSRIRKTNIKILYPELSYVINGLCFNVHNKLGRFSREMQYANELEEELIKNNIKYKRENRNIKNGKFTGNIIDFIIEDKAVIELKAKSVVTKEDYYQTKRYLIDSNIKLGLIVNFRDSYLKPKRVLNNNS